MNGRGLIGLGASVFLVAGMVLAVGGNLKSCSDLPEVTYMHSSVKRVGTYFKNDTPAHDLNWELGIGPNVEWSSTCVGGLVTYAPEVTSHGCFNSASVSDGILNVSITSCTTPLPSRIEHSKLFEPCYLPTSANVPAGDAWLTGSCMASHDTLGAIDCEFAHTRTAVTHAYHAISIPPIVALSAGQVYVANLRVGTHSELNNTSLIVSNTNGVIQFLDTGNTACCAALTGSSSGCPHAGGSVKQVLPVQAIPGGCSIEQDWILNGDRFFAKVTCDDGMEFLDTTPKALLKFCYFATSVGGDVINDDCTANVQSSGPSPYVCYSRPLHVEVFD